MTRPLSMQMAEFAQSADVPAGSRERAHIILLDALVAILSGRRLHSGVAAQRYSSWAGGVQSGGATALEFARLTRVRADDAALINGMLAHADETDDSHEGARMHPSCSIVPAVMAAGQGTSATVSHALDAIAIGYDVGVALNLGTWTVPRELRASRVSTHHTGGLFGSVAACLRILGTDGPTGAVALSYAVQHAGGSTTWLRDTEHVEKAVVFGGLPARSALFCTQVAGLGFSGVADPFGGPESFFDAFGVDGDASVITKRLLTPGLAVQEACIKRYAVGMPLQAVAQALDEILGPGVTAEPDQILVELPAEKVHVVRDRQMTDISAEHVIALRLSTGEIPFDVLHDLAEAPASIERLKDRVELVGVRELDADLNGYGTTRVARVTLTENGRQRVGLVAWPIGTPERPVGWDEVEQKAHEILSRCGWAAAPVEGLITSIRGAHLESPWADLIETVGEVARH